MKIVLILSRALGFIVVFISLVLLIGYAVSYYQGTLEIESIKPTDYIFTSLVFIASFFYFLAWRHEGLGGLIITLVGIAISTISDWRFGLPFFIIGQLFVLYWFLLKKEKRTITNSKGDKPVK